MKKLPSLLFYIALCLVWSACERGPAVGGGWSIEGYKGERSLLANGLELYSDGTCGLPMIDVTENHTPLGEGTWETFSDKGKYYLRITTPNRYFNDTYEVTSFKQMTDTVSWGQLTIMELQSARTWMLCKRADYGSEPDKLPPPKTQD